MCKVLCLNHIVSYYPYGEMLAPSFHKDFYLEVKRVCLVFCIKKGGGFGETFW